MDRKFTRRELYDLVWAEPTRDVAAKLNISDVALGKTCRKANIPVPPRGYWARRQAGQSITRPPLPPRFPGTSDMVGSERSSYSWQGNWREQLIAEPIPPAPVFEEHLTALSKRVRTIVGTVEIPASFENPHPYIAKLLEQDERRRAEYVKYKSQYYAPHYDSGMGRRKLVILNSLFLHFRRLGCSISMTTSQYANEDRKISICVGQLAIGLRLGPANEKVKAGSTATSDMKLRLTLFSSATEGEEACWEDTKGIALEKKLTDIACAILVHAENRYRIATVQNREWRIKRKAEVEEELVNIRAEEARKAKEAIEAERRKRVEVLVEQAAQMERADYIRRYVGKLRALDVLCVSPEQFERWEAWALSEADRLDPCKNGEAAKTIVELDLSKR